MKKHLKRIVCAALSVMMIAAMTGCGTKNSSDGSADASSAVDQKAQAEESADLSGKSLFVYCGAGMKDPASDIVDAFKEATSCDVNITFGNAAQINSQIMNSNEGDLFISGAETELKSLKEKNYVTDTKQLVQHIPVIAVPSGNPAGISSIADLGNGAKLVLGDADATPIGKIADTVLNDAGIMDSADIVARTSTAPEMITALNSGEADAAIVWKENADGKDGVEVLDIPDMDNYIKVIPAASLSCSENADSLAEFLKFLDSDTAHDIWTSYGYVVVR